MKELPVFVILILLAIVALLFMAIELYVAPPVIETYHAVKHIEAEAMAIEKRFDTFEAKIEKITHPFRQDRYGRWVPMSDAEMKTIEQQDSK